MHKPVYRNKKEKTGNGKKNPVDLVTCPTIRIARSVRVAAPLHHHVARFLRPQLHCSPLFFHRRCLYPYPCRSLLPSTVAASIPTRTARCFHPPPHSFSSWLGMEGREEDNEERRQMRSAKPPPLKVSRSGASSPITPSIPSILPPATDLPAVAASASAAAAR